MRVGTAVRVFTHLSAVGCGAVFPAAPLSTLQMVLGNHGFDCPRQLLRGCGVRHSVKCSTVGCHRHKRVSLEELQFLRAETEKAGQRAGLICPVCVKRAFDNPDAYELDIPLGELLVEAAKETPRWRISFAPERLQ